MNLDPRLFAPRLVVIDTETTGLSPDRGDRVVEIGCVELIGCVPSGVEYHAYANPARAMPPGAEAVHGLGDAFLADKPPFADIAAHIVAFIGDSPVIAHNASFDIGFLDAEFARAGHPPLTMARAICTVVLAKARLPGAKHSLDALCSRYGVDLAVRIKHGALIDARLLARVYLELIGGRQIALSLGAPTPATAAAPARIRQPQVARAHGPSAAELEAHAAFLSTIDSPIWNQHAVV